MALARSVLPDCLLFVFDESEHAVEINRPVAINISVNKLPLEIIRERFALIVALIFVLIIVMPYSFYWVSFMLRI